MLQLPARYHIIGETSNLITNKYSYCYGKLRLVRTR
jgi:hypothetical protein